MDTLKECFDAILHGSESESRSAARKVRKLLYSSQGRDQFNDIKNLVNSASGEYAKISEEWRQENFAMAMSVIYFLHDRESEPDFSPEKFTLSEIEGFFSGFCVKMNKDRYDPFNKFRVMVSEVEP